MNPHRPAIDRILQTCSERAKELNCVYEIENRLSQSERPLAEVLQEVVRHHPGRLAVRRHVLPGVACR